MLSLLSVGWGDFWGYAIASVISAVVTAAGGVMLKFYLARGTMQEQKAQREKENLDDHFPKIVRAYEQRSRRMDDRVEQLEKVLDEIREQHRKENEANWDAHRKAELAHERCLQRERFVMQVLRSHEKALKAAQIPFESLELDKEAEVELYGPGGSGDVSG